MSGFCAKRGSSADRIYAYFNWAYSRLLSKPSFTVASMCKLDVLVFLSLWVDLFLKLFVF